VWMCYAVGGMGQVGREWVTDPDPPAACAGLLRGNRNANGWIPVRSPAVPSRGTPFHMTLHSICLRGRLLREPALQGWMRQKTQGQNGCMVPWQARHGRGGG